MYKPVYGLENRYIINEQGELLSLTRTCEPIKNHKGGSCKINRVRLHTDKGFRFFDRKYLVYKTFNPEADVEVNDPKIFYKTKNWRDDSLDNLMIIDVNNVDEVANMLSLYYETDVKPLKDFPHYYIAENGNLYSFFSRRPKKLNPWIGTDGYFQAILTNKFQERAHVKIHQAVASHFVPGRKKGLIVHHKDENKLNNQASNLQWVTHQYNNEFSNGKDCCMVDKYNNVMTIHTSIADLARFYKVDGSTASKQCRGIKNGFNDGKRARFYDKEKHCFIPTRFD